MAFGLRGILAIIIPSAVGMVILAHPLIDLVLAHGAETAADADSTGAALALFALGLPGFCTFLYMVRVFQSMQDTRTAFRLYLVENGLNIVFAVALVGPLGVRGSGPLALDRLHGRRPAGPRRGPEPGGRSRRPRPHHAGQRVLGGVGSDGGGHGAGPQRVRRLPRVSGWWSGWSSPWWRAWCPRGHRRGARRSGGPATAGGPDGCAGAPGPAPDPVPRVPAAGPVEPGARPGRRAAGGPVP